MELQFTVKGDAQPKGSTKILPLGSIVGKLRRGPVTIRSMRELMTSVVITSDNPQVKSWQARIAFEATCLMRRVQLELAGPVHLQVEFFLPRPSGLAKSYDGPHLKKPDTDKLLRALLDALTGVVWRDDSQVISIVAGKTYAGVNEDPRAVITIRSLSTDRRVPLFERNTDAGQPGPIDPRRI